MSFTTIAERSTLLHDVFVKNPTQPERVQVDLDLGDEVLDPITFISFCPYEWQSMLMAIATPTDIHVYKVPINDDILEGSSENGSLACTRLTSFHTETKVVSLSWNTETSVNPPVKVGIFVALEAGGVAHCTWADDTATALVKKLPRHRGIVNSVDVEPLVGQSWASVGNDNLLNVYNEKGEVRAQRMLRTAGKLVRFLENEIMVVELNGTIRFYDTLSVRPLRTAFYRAPLPVKSDCTNGKFACVDARGSIKMHLHSDKPPLEFAGGNLCTAIALSQVGPWCALASHGSFRIIHDQSGQVIQQGNFTSIRHLCWHPQRALLAIAHGSRISILKVQ
ncbi:uncharacterized protein LOC100897636 [Galendromus occidentalis]|uniref:Uncharacterized protein LOC100897636 n=1 Tax=Galendromus occidentalis TaxID=34638 RepID=A0AAJ6VYY8_9ACAR|nr:uncharacterized protein LOC100897636 [Galendromus occidentalis]